LDRYRSPAIGYRRSRPLLGKNAGMKRMLHGLTALAVAASLSQPAFAASPPLVTTQPDPPPDVAPYFIADTDSRWTSPEWSADDIAALRQKIKYVFVIFNENRSFDHEYGTLPGSTASIPTGRIRARPPIRRDSRKATSIRTPARLSP